MTDRGDPFGKLTGVMCVCNIRNQSVNPAKLPFSSNSAFDPLRIEESRLDPRFLTLLRDADSLPIRIDAAR